MYLCIPNKSYYVTNNYNKPYIKINGSILPLTNNGGGVIHCKDNNGNIYRPLEYKSQSSSVTYYTSAINSNGLSSTTALTRSSTSGESYETRSSTYGTDYQTTTISNWYYQIISKNTSMIYTSLTNYGEYFAKATSSATRFSKITIYLDLYFPDSFSNNTYTVMQTGTNLITKTSTVYSRTLTLLTRMVFPVCLSSVSNSSSIRYPATFSCSYVYNNLSSTLLISSTPTQDTIGTSYLTRSSTSKTVYLTCSSTSGYTGVSSSSSESSGWE